MPIEEVRLILSFLVDETPNDWLPNTDAIFALGHIDERVPGHIANLFHMGKAPKIILTGGTGVAGRDPNGFPSEAEFFASVLKKEGVPENVLILEKNSTNTLENVKFGMFAANESDFYPESLILVALPPLLRRARVTFAKQFPSVFTFGSAFPIKDDEWQNICRIRRIVEEIDRLKHYAEKEDIEPVRIPYQVDKAYWKVRSFLVRESA